jgi:hypothetical protein
MRRLSTMMKSSAFCYRLVQLRRQSLSLFFFLPRKPHIGCSPRWEGDRRWAPWCHSMSWGFSSRGSGWDGGVVLEDWGGGAAKKRRVCGVLWQSQISQRFFWQLQSYRLARGVGRGLSENDIFGYPRSKVLNVNAPDVCFPTWNELFPRIHWFSAEPVSGG